MSKALRTRKLYGAVTATTNSVAYIDIPADTVIRGVQFAVTPTSGTPASGDYLQLEVSLSPVSQITTNDANGVIAVFSSFFGLVTSGAGQEGGNMHVGPTAIGLKRGDRVYLNAVEGGSMGWQVQVILHCD